MAEPAGIPRAGGRLRGSPYRPWRRRRAVCAGTAGANISERPHDPDARNQRHDPAEHSCSDHLPTSATSRDAGSPSPHAGSGTCRPPSWKSSANNRTRSRTSPDSRRSRSTSAATTMRRWASTATLRSARENISTAARAARSAARTPARRQIIRHAGPSVADFLRRLIPDVGKAAQQIVRDWIGHPALQIANELVCGTAIVPIELRGEEQHADGSPPPRSRRLHSAASRPATR